MTRSATPSHRTGVAGQPDCAVPNRSQSKSFHCARRSKLFALGALVALVAISAPHAWAAEEHHTVVPAEDVTRSPGPPTLPSGAQVAVLFGSPAEEGPFVIRLKFPAGYEVPAH
jgi:hypothetical protein